MLFRSIAAATFDRIIVKEDDDRRGRDAGVVADLIVKGIVAVNPDVRHEIILDETEAIETALSGVESGGLVVIFPEIVSRAIALIKKRQQIASNGHV